MPEPLNEPDLTSSLRVGMRVVVRHRIDGGFTDALGTLTTAGPAELTVQTRRGPVTILRRCVVAAKEVPPAPVRRGAPHLAVSMTDLERSMVAGMPPLRSCWIGQWLLRESAGYTGRANSALPLGDPGLPVAQALVDVASWYLERAQRPLLQVFGPDGFEVATDVVGAAALDAGWTPFQRTLVLTASVDALAQAAAGHAPATEHVTTAPDNRWWATAAEREQEHQQVAADIFEGVVDGEYLTLTIGTNSDADPVAVGRVAFAHAWAGAFSVHVLPEYRRRGLAHQVMAASARSAQARGIASMYLQVSRDNEAAVALYHSLGFRVHHEYWYLRAPTYCA